MGSCSAPSRAEAALFHLRRSAPTPGHGGRGRCTPPGHFSSALPLCRPFCMRHPAGHPPQRPMNAVERGCVRAALLQGLCRALRLQEPGLPPLPHPLPRPLLSSSSRGRSAWMC